MIKTIVRLKYLVFMLPFALMAGCGYDTALKYKTKGSTSYRLKITAETPQQAELDLRQAFLQENLQLVRHHLYNDIDRSYAIFHSSSYIYVKLRNSEGFRRAIVAIYPARLASVSSKRRAQLEQREEALLRIEKQLKQTDSFSKYIPSEWERDYMHTLRTGKPPLQ